MRKLILLILLLLLPASAGAWMAVVMKGGGVPGDDQPSPIWSNTWETPGERAAMRRIGGSTGLDYAYSSSGLSMKGSYVMRLGPGVDIHMPIGAPTGLTEFYITFATRHEVAYGAEQKILDARRVGGYNNSEANLDLKTSGIFQANGGSLTTADVTGSGTIADNTRWMQFHFLEGGVGTGKVRGREWSGGSWGSWTQASASGAFMDQYVEFIELELNDSSSGQYQYWDEFHIFSEEYSGDPSTITPYSNSRTTPLGGVEASSSNAGVLSNLSITGGNSIVACASNGADNNNSLTYWDGSGNQSLTRVANHVGQSRNVDIWVLYDADASTGSGSLTYDSDQANGHHMVAWEVSGMANLGFDKTASADGSSSAFPSSGDTATTTDANQLLVGCTRATVVGRIMSPREDTAIHHQFTNDNQVQMVGAIGIVSSTGQYSSGAYMNTSGAYNSIIATFELE